MAKMQANQMRAGMVIEFEGQRYTILKQNIMIPGKGAAVIQVEMRNIKSGAKKDQRWRTADTVERLTTEDKEFTFSYADGEQPRPDGPRRPTSRPRSRRTSWATACPSCRRT
jgi:elongation factor P